jgi:DNA-binding IscR family transcriptional regulator
MAAELEAGCGVRGSWQLVNNVLDNALRAVSLADMLKPQPPRPPRRVAAVPLSEIPMPVRARRVTTE